MTKVKDLSLDIQESNVRERGPAESCLRFSFDRFDPVRDGSCEALLKSSQKPTAVNYKLKLNSD